jgi:predicted metal-dependent RNase
MLAKAAYDGPVFTTRATRDLCAAMRADTAMIHATSGRGRRQRL